MDDIEEIPVEATAGHRPTGTVGDRMLIGLAAAALLGGALIAVGNFLSGLTDEVAIVPTPVAATSSAQPSRTPRPTATPRPLREVTVQPGNPAEQPLPEFDPPAWIRAVGDLPVFAEPLIDGRLLRTISAGAIVFGESAGTPGWYFVQEPLAGGFVRVVGDDGASVADVVPVQQGFAAGQVAGLFAGPTRFVAHLQEPVPAYRYPRTATIHSDDGMRWQPARGAMQLGYGMFAAAWGPAGLLASATTDLDGGTTAWLWESADGSGWIAIGSLDTGGDGYVQQLAGSSDGYLLVMHSSRGATIWFSPDGIAWQEGRLPFTPSQAYDFGPPTVQVVPTRAGFVVWTSVPFDAASAQIALTRNGRSWVGLDSPAEPVRSLRLAVAGQWLTALGRAADGSVRAWRGVIGAAGGRLERVPGMEGAFENAVVSALTSDGDRAYAFGYERRTGKELGWIGDGDGWRSMAVPDFGGVIRHAAAGPMGLVVAGAHGHDFVTAPLLWHRGASGIWSADQAPVVSPLAPPSAEECPPPPYATLDFIALEPAVAVACRGDEPLTVTAFSVRCPDCFGGGPPDQDGPEWLIAPQHGLLLMPFEAGQDSGWWRIAVLHPDTPWREEYAGTWVRLVGHFDDPAAAECGAEPPEGAEDWWGGPELDITACRQTFVVTELSVVEPPS